MLRLRILIPFLLLTGFGAHQAAAQNWTLVWADEFDYTGAPDPTKWDYDIGGGGWGNQELQFYTDRTENARVDGSTLIVEARAEATSGSSYSSARLKTMGKMAWKYGRIEARAQVPTAEGTWPAIWMLSEDTAYGTWPASGEIDIMEHAGRDPGLIHTSLHLEAGNGLTGNFPTGTKRVSTATTDFHVYAVEWEPREIRFYIDDELVDLRFPGTSTSGAYVNPQRGWQEWPYDQPFHVLINLAIGGTFGGSTVDNGAFPAQLLVDYVRVYENTGTLPNVTLGSVPSTVDAGGSLMLNATASDPDGQMESTELLQGEVALLKQSGGSASLTLQNVQPGCYSVSARGTDEAGWQTQTDPVDVVVGTGCPQAPVTMAPQPIPGTVQAEYYDLGGSGVAYTDLDPANNAGAFRADESVEVALSADGSRYYVTGIARREWIEYTVDVDAGTYLIEADVRGAGGFSLELDGAAVADFSLPSNSDWHTVSATDVTLPGGVQVLRFAPSQAGFELDFISFEETGAAPMASLDEPAVSGTIAAGGDLALAASVSDPDQDLAEVSFMQGIGVLATFQQAPFQATVNGVSEGCYSVWARAIDSRGNEGMTELREIQAGSSCAQAPYLMRPAAIPGPIRLAYFDLGPGHSDLTTGDGVFRSEPVDLAWDADEGYYLTDVASREWVEYTIEVRTAGTYDVSARVRTAAGGGFELEVDGQALGGRRDVAATGGDWQTQQLGSVDLAAGTQVLRIDVRSGGFEMATLRFSAPGTTALNPDLPSILEIGAAYPNPANRMLSIPVT
ncbi:MAG: family 16 glycosylhydrolase, partial [Rhodothermales bacterium]|nr:family 16 glycosylhydrolase [Rhodothermales bacterium]